MKLLSAAFALLLAVCLCGCSNETTTSVDFSVEDSFYISVTSEEVITSFNGSFLVRTLAGKTKEDMLNQYSPAIFYNDSLMEGVLNTPVSLLIKSMNQTTLISYDKGTGVFTDACRDPLCDHESCLWSAAGSRIYAGIGCLFFLMKQDSETILYKSDYDGAAQTVLYRSSNELSHVVQEGAYVYFLEETLDETSGNDVCRIVRISENGSDMKVLLEQAGLYYFMPMNKSIMYWDPEEGFLLYDTETKQTQKYGSSGMRPIALYGENFYYESEGALFKTGDYGFGNPLKLVTERGFSELVFDHDAVYCYDESTIYRIKSDFSGLEPLYTATMNERITNVILDGDLLCYQYTAGSGAARKHYYVFVDLETNKHLEVIND